MDANPDYDKPIEIIDADTTDPRDHVDASPMQELKKTGFIQDLWN